MDFLLWIGAAFTLMSVIRFTVADDEPSAAVWGIWAVIIFVLWHATRPA